MSSVSEILLLLQNTSSDDIESALNQSIQSFSSSHQLSVLVQLLHSLHNQVFEIDEIVNVIWNRIKVQALWSKRYASLNELKLAVEYSEFVLSSPSFSL